MYNQQVLGQLARQSNTVVPATLTSGTVTYTFLINPESMQWSHTGTFSSLPVLNTAQPQAKYKYSESKLTLPKILLWSASNNLDIGKLNDQLAIWCKLGAVLNFFWGSTSIPQCSIKQYTCNVTQLRSGKPTKAEANLELLIIPAIAKVKPSLKVTPTARESKKLS